jgi:ABC-type multidrug transport system ATPase subunit
MRITLIDAGKRFNRDWIFRRLSYTFIPGISYAIAGPNGSGKSTLLQVLAGAIGISEGRIRYAAEASATREYAGPDAVSENGEIAPEIAYKHLSLAAPYLELIEEMTALEFLRFHGSFKPFLPGLGELEILREVGLGTAAHKQIRYFSSGMKQRLKLAQAIFSDTPVLLLDEPCTNLDADGAAMYRELMVRYGSGYEDGRLTVVSSNDLQEYEFCDQIINMMDHK